MAIGFTHFDDLVEDPGQTLQDRLDDLTNQQKNQVLKGFAAEVPEDILRWDLLEIPFDLIKLLYRELKRLDQLSLAIMREEVVITPATYDGEGNELTPAVYNTAPTTVDGLKSDLEPEFTDSFDSQEISAIVNKMVEMSKSDGTGDWTYYTSKV